MRWLRRQVQGCCSEQWAGPGGDWGARPGWEQLKFPCKGKPLRVLQISTRSSGLNLQV